MAHSNCSGYFQVRNKDGKGGVHALGLTESGGGGTVIVRNRTGEQVVQIHADEYGMGAVGVFDREGKGRTLTPR